MKVSLGMFTVYDAMQKDLADTIGRVARLGYDGIEMFGEIPCPSEELRAILEQNHIPSAAGMWNGDICSPKQLQKRFATIKHLEIHSL